MAMTCEFLEPVPDLLRRFVSTPHRTTLVMGSHIASVETNSEELLRSIPAPAGDIGENGLRLRVKVIVDPDLQLTDNSAPIIMDAGAVLWGRAPNMLFAADCQAQTVQVFMRTPESAAFRDFVSNVICGLLLPPGPR